jgi:hypothetical protein
MESRPQESRYCLLALLSTFYRSPALCGEAAVGPAGIEPTPCGLKVCCAASYTTTLELVGRRRLHRCRCNIACSFIPYPRGSPENRTQRDAVISRIWATSPRLPGCISRDGRTRTDDSVSPEHVGLPLPYIPFFFPVRTAGFEPRAPAGTDADWSLLVSDQARCQASPRSVADRAHIDRSGLGGDRILVSGSSGRRSTVSATSPNRRPDVAVTPGFHVSPAKSVAECHNRQRRGGSVFAGWPATYLAPFCLRLQLDHKVIMYGISSSKRPHRCWGDCLSLQYWTRQHAHRFAKIPATLN